MCWMEAGAPLPMLKGGGTHGDLGGSGFGHQSQVPPSLIRPPAGLGRCFQGGIAVKSQGVTQQRDISRRSISSTMNQSHKQPTKQPPSRASPAWAGAAPGMVPPSVSRRWGGCRGHGEHHPQLIGASGVRAPPRRQCLSKMLQPEGFAGENADEGGNNIWQTIPPLLLFYFCLMVGV